jgi:hypothetical protein
MLIEYLLFWIGPLDQKSVLTEKNLNFPSVNVQYIMHTSLLLIKGAWKKTSQIFIYHEDKYWSFD